MEESDRALKRMQKRLREEELRILRGEQDVDERVFDEELREEANHPEQREMRQRAGAAHGRGRDDGFNGRGGGRGRKNVVGGMMED